MNSTATGGKNLRKPERGEKGKGAYEIRLVSTSAPNAQHLALFSSLCEAKRTPVGGHNKTDIKQEDANGHLLPRKRTPVSFLASPPTPRTARNYGPRRLRYRKLDGLKAWQVHMLHQADAVASQLGLPLNMFVTVNHLGTFAGGSAMASTFKRGMKRMVQWLRSKGLPAAYVYVHENPNDEKPNSHYLVHVPAKLIRAFTAKAGAWFNALDGGVRVEHRNDAQRRAQGKTTRLQYMAKGAPFLACRDYEGFRAKGGQGPIHIKRAGVSELLSKGFCGTIKRAAA